LKLKLFYEVEEWEEAYLLENKILTDTQVQRFHGYHKDRRDEIVERFENYIETLSNYEKVELLKKLEKMV